MPEGFIPWAETRRCIWRSHPRANQQLPPPNLAAQKKDIMQSGVKPVPLHLRNPSTRLQREWGFGKGYKYPHAYPEAWVEQDYLPEELVGRQFYTAKDQGQEPRLAARLARLRRRSS